MTALRRDGKTRKTEDWEASPEGEKEESLRANLGESEEEWRQRKLNQ